MKYNPVTLAKNYFLEKSAERVEEKEDLELAKLTIILSDEKRLLDLATTARCNRPFRRYEPNFESK